MTERHQIAYVTQTEPQRRIVLDLPRGLISPPFLDLHEPGSLAGSVRFYHAQAYALEVRS